MPETDTLPYLSGPPVEEAEAVLLVLHGRGATADGMRPLVDAVTTPATAVLAPQARGHTWYPNRFLVERDANEPWLSDALDLLERIVTRCEEAGVTRDRLVVTGFSQGACLAVEYVARQPARYAGVVTFAGALIGPDPASGGYAGDLRGTPIHLAVGRFDEHVPPAFVRDSATVLEGMHAAVTLRVHDGMGHTIHPEDVVRLADLLKAVA